MQKGFSSLFVTVLVVLLVILPVTLWVVVKAFNPSSSVKGVSTEEPSQSTGLSINIVSQQGSWDLIEYGCKSLEDCSRYQTISGGKTAGHNVFVEYSPDLDSFTHLKFVVKPALGISGGTYSVQSDLGATVDGLQGIVVPVEALKSGTLNSTTFSDSK